MTTPAQHEYASDPAAHGYCVECGLPRGNARHSTTPSPEAVRRTAIVKQTVRAAESPHVAVALDADAESLAAAAVASVNAPGARRAVLQAIADAEHGMTDAELYLALPSYSPNTVRPRRTELDDAGLIVVLRDALGHAVVRKAHKVWVLSDLGRQALTLVAPLDL